MEANLEEVMDFLSRNVMPRRYGRLEAENATEDELSDIKQEIDQIESEELPQYRSNGIWYLKNPNRSARYIGWKDKLGYD